MKKVMICGRDNLKRFKQTLKEKQPEFYPVIVSLYQEGLIDGLRGAKIEILDRNINKPKKTPQTAQKPTPKA